VKEKKANARFGADNAFVAFLFLSLPDTLKEQNKKRFASVSLCLNYLL
jgi:hypothetical protein